ncbi:MAG: alpha/beta fold hydrolase [Marinibacterium sp.]|nr:alpha/beta fold hydrolase [Marinibacterium sp.]
MNRLQDGTAWDASGPENAPAVVLIHGLGLDRQVTWDAITPALARRYRVLRYDFPGHGESAPVAGLLDLSDLSAQVFAVMDAAGVDQAAMVGFSLGGMINRRCAMDHPDRVRALAILNSPHERSSERQALVEEQARAADAGGPAATIDVALARWFTDGAQPNMVAWVRDTVLGCDPESYAAHRLVLAEGVKELIRPAPPLQHPTLVMTCEEDVGSTPEMSQAIAAEIEGSELQVLPELRHLGLVERPDLFAAPLAAFLER